MGPFSQINQTGKVCTFELPQLLECENVVISPCESPDKLRAIDMR